MSIFNESILPKITEISKAYVKTYNEALKEALLCFDQFEVELKNGRVAAREKTLQDRNVLTTLQSIKENEDEKATENNNTKTNDERNSTENGTEKRGSKKRSKNEVDGMSSPEQDKRQKRNASVKAQSIISKQKKNDDSVIFVSSEVNVNLTQKLRRENSIEKSKSHRRKDDNKENSEPIPAVQIKQEKISCPPEPEQMDTELLPLNIPIKQEPNKDDIAMPPPAVPLARGRKGMQKEKSDLGSGDETTRSRSARTKKKAELPPPVPSTRSTRSSSRLTKQTDSEEVAAPEVRPKRTRGKKATPETSTTDGGKDSQTIQDSLIGSPADKPRPKRTRRARKVSEKQQEQPKSNEQTLEILISPKEERISQPDRGTIVIENSTKVVENGMDGEQNEIDGKQNNFDDKHKRIDGKQNNIDDKNKIIDGKQKQIDDKHKRIDGKQKHIDGKHDDNDGEQNKIDNKQNDIDGKLNAINGKQNDINNEQDENNISDNNIDGGEIDGDVLRGADTKSLDKTTVLSKLDATVTISTDLDKSIVLSNGAYKHANIAKAKPLNETVVIESSNRDTVVLDKHVIMDATVVIEKDPKMTNLTDDNSLLTDDDESIEMRTPPKQPPAVQPTSAVKEKVQQFEELASRVTRTKTRALAKKDEPTETQTPPDRAVQPTLAPDTLTKMNSLIFNGKIPQVSSSASKLNNVSMMKSQIPTSSSKLSGVLRAREAAEDARREKEDARRKKEAMLDAKREMHKRKREEKMAAAAAAREAAERERRAALAAAERGRQEKQLHADVSKLERQREVERKKLELARKLAETEERRRAEEAARQERLAEEQRRAEAHRRRQQEEAEAIKKEVSVMANEFERKQREFLEQQKMKKRMEANKISTPLKYRMEPVYMEGGFQYLNSDEEASPVRRPDVPSWSTSKSCLHRSAIQDRLKTSQIDKLFSVREQTADLREIFPAIDRSRLKRTSSAVWRTPPSRLAELPE